MRRAKLGDVYAIELPNGYKIFQWAYRIPRKGDYIRVFDGLYETIPNDVEQVVAGPHSYIIAFFASRAYRIGLISFITNLPVPEEYPFPRYAIRFDFDMHRKIYAITLRDLTPPRFCPIYYSYEVTSIKDLPLEFRDVKLVDGFFHPARLMYFFNCGFDLEHPERFSCFNVWGENCEEKLQAFADRVDELWEKDKEKRRKL